MQGNELILFKTDPEQNLQFFISDCVNEKFSLKIIQEWEKLLEVFRDQDLSVLVLSGYEEQLLSWVKKIKQESSSIKIFCIDSSENVQRALRLGALDVQYYFAPQQDHKAKKIGFQLLRQPLETRLPLEILDEPNKYRFENFPSLSENVKKLYDLVGKVSKSDSTVLILGESGTGKELIARMIHFQSDRSRGPLVAVNCGAISEGVLESELFGHEKGAFTGAHNTRKGRFEMAHGGTLFLDEIGEMSLKLQVKLLRALQEKKIEHVGGNKSIEVDVRIIAATNRDLEHDVATGVFREDLYYRLNVIPVKVPALRDRKDDIPFLLERFIKQFCLENQLAAPLITKDTIDFLCQYPWPGNVRELENLAERMVVLYSGKTIKNNELIEQYLHVNERVSTSVQISDQGISFKDVVNQFENDLILKALDKTGWNKNKAASLLNLNRTTLVEKIKKRHLEKVIHN